MRFKFAGGRDAPDWFLAETVFLSQISAVRFKLIVIVVYRHLLGAPLEHEKLVRYLSIREGGSSASDTRALVAAVSLILRGGCKYAVPLAELQAELQQIGLPREHGVLLARPYVKYSPPLAARLKHATLSAAPSAPPLQWRVDWVLARSHSGPHGRPEAQLKLAGAVFNLSQPQLLALLADARAALAAMPKP